MSKAPLELLQTYRRTQILKAASEVISESGYDRSSVDQIAKRAGLSRSTIYEYFPSKDEILKGCFAAQREDLAESLARRIDRASGMEQQLAAFFEICLSRVDRNREFFRAIAFPIPLYEATAQEGPGSTEFALVLKNFNDEMDRILDDGLGRGELRQPVGPAERDSLGTLLVGAMSARSRLDAPPPIEESAASLASFALRGLGFALD
ncbi:MAG: TetR/AcrR family transcriptional regulator [bacterium]|nr:TetR/AcrR family transcriptional regulator [bacterium]MCP5066874.1 TetR/AcrR family transcriptional regulator [bacterium]